MILRMSRLQAIVGGFAFLLLCFSCKSQQNPISKDSMDTKSDSPTINFTGTKVSVSTIYIPEIGRGEFELKNLTDKTLVLSLQNVVCRIGENEIPISNFNLYGNIEGHPQLDQSSFELKPEDDLSINVSFESFPRPNGMKGPVTVEAEILCEEKTYHAESPINLQRRIPRR